MITQTKAPVSTADPVKIIEPLSPTDTTDQYKLNHEKFASLGTADDFISLKENLVAIDIQDLLQKLGDDDFFEVQLPVVGMTDFLTQDPNWLEIPQQFPHVIALNGYGALPESHSAQHFPKPYFIVVQDIAGNSYELLVSPSGHVEIPEQGTGLFSMLTSITYIYGAKQVLEGAGLHHLGDAGAESGMLYLLPPPGVQTHFTPILGISHMDETFDRQLEVEHKVPIMFQDMPDHSEAMTIQKELLNQADKALLHLEMIGQFNQAHPKTIRLDLESMEGIQYTPLQSDPSQNAVGPSWTQVSETQFEKKVGLSEFGSLALVRDVFSEYDFTQALLNNESFGIEQKNGFNDFVLRPEAIGPYYDMLTHAVIDQKLPGEFLLSHIPDERWVELDLSHAPLDQHDSEVIANLQEHFQHYDFTPLDQLFLSEQGDFSDQLYLQVQGEISELPHITYTIDALDSDAGPIDHAHNLDIPDLQHLMMSDTLMGGEQGLKNFIDLPNESEVFVSDYGHQPMALAPNHQATVLHFDDVMELSPQGDVIQGFEITQDKIDLSGLLDQFGATQEQVKIQPLGQDLQITVTDQSGQDLPVATLIGSNAGPLPDDLNQIIITDT